MPTLCPLHKTAAEFKQWRANKNGPGESTPMRLRKQAIELTTHHSVSQVIKTLGLSGSVIKRWQTELADGAAGCSTPPTVCLITQRSRKNIMGTKAHIVV